MCIEKSVVTWQGLEKFGINLNSLALSGDLLGILEIHHPGLRHFTGLF
jgi:hypothetical protein